MDSDKRLATLTGFAPVLASDTKILILGSFPGAASLAAQQYYAHPRNQFWRLLSAVLNDDLSTLPYQQRLQRLLAHQLGVWDVLAACEREGSLDADIRRPQANDFGLLKQQCPQLRRIGFNGKTSAKFASLFTEAGFDTMHLPSSSPAYAQLNFEQKLDLWRGITR